MRDPTSLFAGEVSPGTKKFADMVSMITQPPFIAIAAFILLNLQVGDIVDQLLLDVVCIVSALVIPVGVTYYFGKKHGNEELDVERREDRFPPLILGTLGYVVGAVVLYLMDAPSIVWVLMACYAVVTAAITVITLYWKISIHACGCVGPSMALTLQFGTIGALFFLFLPFAVWSRYVKRKHTPAQLVCGALLGAILSGIVFALLL